MGAAGVSEAALQPGKAIFQQGDGLLSPRAAVALARIITAQKLHQSRGHLLGGSARSLSLDGVPFPVGDGQRAEQPFGQVVGPIRPAGASGGRGPDRGASRDIIRSSSRVGGGRGSLGGGHWTSARLRTILAPRAPCRRRWPLLRSAAAPIAAGAVCCILWRRCSISRVASSRRGRARPRCGGVGNGWPWPSGLLIRFRRLFCPRILAPPCSGEWCVGGAWEWLRPGCCGAELRSSQALILRRRTTPIRRRSTSRTRGGEDAGAAAAPPRTSSRSSC